MRSGKTGQTRAGSNTRPFFASIATPPRGGTPRRGAGSGTPTWRSLGTPRAREFFRCDDTFLLANPAVNGQGRVRGTLENDAAASFIVEPCLTDR